MTLRSLRESSGLTQEQTARALDVTLRTITRWEQGAGKVPAWAISSLAKAFKTTKLRVLEAVEELPCNRKAG